MGYSYAVNIKLSGSKAELVGWHSQGAYRENALSRNRIKYYRTS
jgi:hypothetical protein